jgi:hypothetical protein
MISIIEVYGGIPYATNGNVGMSIEKNGVDRMTESGVIKEQVV